MIKIGEFVKISGITINMLRHYDKIGLLKPKYVDKESGYRYYDECQVKTANEIQVLKSLGFSLKEIKDIQLDTNNTDNIKSFLKCKISEKEQEIKEANIQIKRMKKAILDLDKEKSCALSVTVKTIPRRKVASLRGIIHRFQDEGILWDEISKKCKKNNIKLIENSYSYAINHGVDFKKMDIDVEVQIKTPKIYKDFDNVKFKEIEETMAACILFEGNYNQIGEIYKYAYEWIKENNYKLIGLSFTTYYVSPANEKNPQKFITEICFPIKK